MLPGLRSLCRILLECRYDIPDEIPYKIISFCVLVMFDRSFLVKKSFNVPFDEYSVIMTGRGRFIKSIELYPINFIVDG